MHKFREPILKDSLKRLYYYLDLINRIILKHSDRLKNLSSETLKNFSLNLKIGR